MRSARDGSPRPVHANVIPDRGPPQPDHQEQGPCRNDQRHGDEFPFRRHFAGIRRRNRQETGQAEQLAQHEVRSQEQRVSTPRICAESDRARPAKSRRQSRPPSRPTRSTFRNSADRRRAIRKRCRTGTRPRQPLRASADRRNQMRVPFSAKNRILLKNCRDPVATQRLTAGRTPPTGSSSTTMRDERSSASGSRMTAERFHSLVRTAKSGTPPRWLFSVSLC